MSYQPTVRGYVVGPGEGVPDRTPDVKASGRSTGGSLTVMELAADGGPPRHTHTREDESLYVFTGVVDVECGEDRFEARPGAFVFLPCNMPHAFRSVAGPVTGLLIVTPGGLESYFAEPHAAMRSNADPAEVKRIQDAYGIVRS
jgi:quercetin dioxygenase-like cupin family protein